MLVVIQIENFPVLTVYIFKNEEEENKSDWFIYTSVYVCICIQTCLCMCVPNDLLEQILFKLSISGWGYRLSPPFHL